jgi:sterol desaturase/sphingolipid hydroxylase (fatty acid hydroxylase superfamily)
VHLLHLLERLTSTVDARRRAGPPGRPAAAAPPAGARLRAAAAAAMRLPLVAPLYGGGFLPAFCQVALLYYSAAALLHYAVPRAFPVASVQVGAHARGQVAREAGAALGPLAVKAAVWAAVEALHARGGGLLYAGPIDTPAGVAYALLTWVLLDYLHDTWFYWTHRLLHLPAVYRRVHAEHHRSTVPTAFAGYAFHVAEAALVFANELLVCLFFPIHAGLHRAYHLATTLIHVGGHAGYEIAPWIPSAESLAAAALWRGRPALRALNTVRHHDMHHRFPRAHFSLYFCHWDRWCGTEHPCYAAAAAAHFGPGGPAAAAKALKRR